MQKLNFNVPLELKFLAKTGVFEGYASVFNVTDKVNDKIIRGAFKKSLDSFRVNNSLPPLLWQHNTAEPIGKWIEMYEDQHGLFVKGELFIEDINLAKEAYKLLQEKVVNGLSIGYRVVDSFIESKNNIRVLTQVQLEEVSLVTFPANQYARVSNIKKQNINRNNIPTQREVEAVLRSGGLSRRQAKAVVALGYKALDSNSEIENIKKLTEDIKRAAEEIKFYRY